jgi:hypothetical protein
MARREGKEVAGRGRNCAAAPDRLGSEVKKKKGRGGEGADRRGPVVSASGKKKRGSGEVGRRGGGLGRLGRKGSRAVYFFFFSFFKLHFSNHFSSQIQFKLFQTFLKNFIDFLETSQATMKPCKPKDDAHTLVVSKFIKLSLIFFRAQFK